jgi:capsular exopolysaccharide synthesis family protein
LSLESIAPAPSRDDAPIGRVLRVLRDRWWIPLVCALACAFGAVLVARAGSPEYQATSRVLFRDFDIGSALFGSSLHEPVVDPARNLATNTELVKSDAIAAAVVRALHLRTDPDALRRHVRIFTESASDIADIEVTSDRPGLAARIANAYAREAVRARREADRTKVAEAHTTLVARRDSLPVTAVQERRDIGDAVNKLITLDAVQTGNTEVADFARVPAEANPRNVIRSGVVAGILGVALGLALAFALERVDPRLKGSDELERRFGVPVLARIPRRASSGRNSGHFREAFRVLAAMIRLTSEHERIRSIVVTSPTEKAGKTTVASELAFAAVEAGQRVVLVEADVKEPRLARIIEPSVGAGGFSAGLTLYLDGKVPIERVIRSTPQEGLGFVPAGAVPPTGLIPLLEGEEGRAFVEELSDRADLVLIDCAAVGTSADAVILAARADAALLVVDLRRSNEGATEAALQRLRASGTSLLGAVSNRDGATIHTVQTNGARPGASQRIPRRPRAASSSSKTVDDS